MRLLITLLSQASTYDCSQLKRQNLSVGSYTENVLKWFNYPLARAHPCKVSCHGTCIVSLSVIHRGQPDSGESCIMLQSRYIKWIYYMKGYNLFSKSQLEECFELSFKYVDHQYLVHLS